MLYYLEQNRERVHVLGNLLHTYLWRFKQVRVDFSPPLKSRDGDISDISAGSEPFGSASYSGFYALRY